MAVANIRLRLRRMAQNGLFVAALILLAGLLGFLALQTRTQWDISQGERNSLSQVSVEALKKFDGSAHRHRICHSPGCPTGKCAQNDRRISDSLPARQT